MIVGRHPAADVDPCEWRRFVIDPGCGALRRMRDQTVVDTIGGSLSTDGYGAFRDERDPAVRWFVSPLDGRSTANAVRRRQLGGLPEDAVSMSIRHDAALGVSVVALRLDAPCMSGRLDDVAIDAVAAVLVAELLPTPVDGGPTPRGP